MWWVIAKSINQLSCAFRHMHIEHDRRIFPSGWCLYVGRNWWAIFNLMFTFTILTTDHTYVVSIRTIRWYALTQINHQTDTWCMLEIVSFFRPFFSKFFRLETINCKLEFELKYDSIPSWWSSCARCEIVSATRCGEREVRAPYCEYTNAIEKYHCRSDSCVWSGFLFIKSHFSCANDSSLFGENLDYILIDLPFDNVFHALSLISKDKYQIR